VLTGSQYRSGSSVRLCTRRLDGEGLIDVIVCWKCTERVYEAGKMGAVSRPGASAVLGFPALRLGPLAESRPSGVSLRHVIVSLRHVMSTFCFSCR